jgi:hypothetical protein
MKNKALDSNLDFAGMTGDGVNRAANSFAKNTWSGHSNDGRDVNKGRGPLVGNASSSPMDVGPSVTKDAKQMTIATAKQGGKINGGTRVTMPANPDKINQGLKR